MMVTADPDVDGSFQVTLAGLAKGYELFEDDNLKLSRLYSNGFW